MNEAWYLSQDGQEFGPYNGAQLHEFAKEGRLRRESLLWAEGMTDWIRAEAVEGLFPPAPLPPPVPVGRGVFWAGNPTLVNQPQQGPGWIQGSAWGAVPGEDYPALAINPVKPAYWLGIYLSGLVMVVVAVTKSDGGGPGLDGLLGLILLAAGVVKALGYLSRAWLCLVRSTPRTTPGKAVGFLFIPFFSFYWIFVAYYGFARDWNRIIAQHPNLARGPRMNEALFLVYCIVGILLWPINLLLLVPVVMQLCQAINFMASKPTCFQGALARPGSGHQRRF